jgi:glycosyltransferase involved in cell wall biosynthesis
MPDTVEKSGDFGERTIVYALGIYINPGMRNLLLEYLKRSAPSYKAVHVIFCYWWPGIEPEPFVEMVNSLGIENLKAHEFSIMASPAYGRKLGWPGANWLNAYRVTMQEITKMALFLRGIDADLVHIILTEYQSTYAFARAAKLADVPARLLSFTGVAPTPARFRRFVNRMTDKFLTGVLLASSADSSAARDYFPATPQSVVHGWGLAPDLFKLEKVNSAKIRDEFGLGGNDLLIGTTTRIAPNKGQETLIRALPEVIKKFPKLTCLILGGRYDSDQGERARLESLADELGVSGNIRFIGEREDAPDIFAAYDVAVHLADFDYLPFGVIECMALGKACLCTMVGGIPDLITDKVTGILVPPGDYLKASQALIRLLDDPELRKKLGQSARKLVLERYNLDRLVERVKHMYSDALKGELRPEYRD